MLAALEQPVWEVSSRAELGDGDVDRFDAGVEVAVTVAVALCSTASVGPAVLRAGDSVRIHAEQGVGHVLE